MKLDQSLEQDKSKLTNGQYKFVSEIIWGSVPIDRQWAEETTIFKQRVESILKTYPMMDKSDFNIKRCKSFVKGVKRIDGKVVMYISYRKKKLLIDRDENGNITSKSLTDKNNFDVLHLCRIKTAIYGYIFTIYCEGMDFKNSLAAGAKFV